MSKSKKTSAAIVGLLDAIKSEGIQPFNDANVIAPKLGDHIVKEHNVGLLDDKTENNSIIPYQIKMIDTELCNPWHLANRLREYVTEDSCADLIESMKKIGQQIPALVRKNKHHEGYDLICGVRRLFSCKYLNTKIKVAVVELSDQEALLAMDAENRPREDISPYERACDYKRWIENGVYSNYTEIREAIGVKKSWFSQLMALADLHQDIVKAFGHPANLKQKWGYELQLLCKKDEALTNEIIKTARELIANPIPSASVFKKLKNVRIDKKPSFVEKPTWIMTSKNKKIFKVKYSQAGRAQMIFNKRLSTNLIEKIISSAKSLIETEEA